MDYLKIYEKFSDVKEVKDYIDDVRLLRYYYRMQQFTQMQNHIQTMTVRYFAETVIWNTINPDAPKTYEQSYINAENFLQMQGAVIVVKNVKNYAQRLNAEELSFIESMLKLME